MWKSVANRSVKHDASSRCYMDSTPSIIAAKAAAVAEAGDRWSAAPESTPIARALSSLRVQPDFSVMSAGQTTRLKFALCDVSCDDRVFGEDAYLGYEASLNQSKRHLQPSFSASGKLSQSSFLLTPELTSPNTFWFTPNCCAHAFCDVVLPPGICRNQHLWRVMEI
jgi:hypothetical protein